MALDADADIGLSDHLAAATVRINISADGSVVASGGTAVRIENGLVISPP